MDKVYIDTETCGLHGMPVLLQYAVNRGPITLYEIWRRPVGKTLDLIEWLMTMTIVGFNLSFDMFQLVKVYTIFRLCPRDWIPEEHIDEIALKEIEAQSGPALKPASALDLLLHSRKGPYQSLMARGDIRIRRVPTPLAYALAEELENRIQIDGIYFAGHADQDAPRWHVFDIKKKGGGINPDFKDVVLRFSPKSGLKFLAEHALGLKPKFHYKDVELDRKHSPKELGYAPYALAISRPEKKWEVHGRNKKGERTLLGYAWPGVIKLHIDHWATRPDAREYAQDDIVYTRGLDEHFENPEPGDDDSILACMVPVVRWRGFTIDIKGMAKLLAKSREQVRSSPVNVNKPAELRRWIGECMDDMEALAIEETTKKKKLQEVANWEFESDEPCTKCEGKGCARCNDAGAVNKGRHPAAMRAKKLLDIKVAKKEIELYTKLLRAKKFHASFNVIGTLSTRMSGTDGLNAQGIKATKEVRCMFPLAWDGFVLSGGDFDSFEVTLADAVYNDPKLREALVTRVECHECRGCGKAKCKACKKRKKADPSFTNDPTCAVCQGGGFNQEDCEECEGCGKATKKLHTLFAMSLYPGKSYEDIMASKDTEDDLYKNGKSGVFGMIYGGDHNTLIRNLGIATDIAKAAFDRFEQSFPGIKKARGKTFKKFCSMTQPGGIGSQVVWADPSDYVESFLGFRRYFTLENMICRALFDLARKPPKEWRDCKVKVVRRDKVQTAGGAVASALYGAAFQIQAANMRAAANHEIQSPGGQITKDVQRRIWNLQPAGIHELVVAPMNVHDEILCVTRPDCVPQVTEQVRAGVEFYRPKVPLIGMTWNQEMASWAEKKGGSLPVKIRAAEMAV
jgi:hypothetical protein